MGGVYGTTGGGYRLLELGFNPKFFLSWAQMGVVYGTAGGGYRLVKTRVKP